MVYTHEENLKIKRELDIRNRANLLSGPAMRLALLSIQNVDELERVVKIGEDLMRDILRMRNEFIDMGMKIALEKDLKDEKNRKS